MGRALVQELYGELSPGVCTQGLEGPSGQPCSAGTTVMSVRRQGGKKEEWMDGERDGKDRKRKGCEGGHFHR